MVLVAVAAVEDVVDGLRGFPDSLGFRAGTSHSFYFFDVEENSSKNLIVHPFSIMDVSLNDYLKLDPKKSLVLIKTIIRSIKSVNGTFISIWHNESLNFSGRWLGWENVYSEMIKYAIKQ